MHRDVETPVAMQRHTRMQAHQAHAQKQFCYKAKRPRKNNTSRTVTFAHTIRNLPMAHARTLKNLPMAHARPTAKFDPMIPTMQLSNGLALPVPITAVTRAADRAFLQKHQTETIQNGKAKIAPIEIDQTFETVEAIEPCETVADNS